MKLKKRYIVILLLIITISIVGFIFKQKNIQISSVFNKEYEEASINFEKNPNEEYSNHCYNNYKNLTNLVLNETINGRYFQIVKSENNNLGYDAYIIDGCTWSEDSFIKEYIKEANNTNICQSLKNLASDNYSFNTVYNNSVCISEYGYDKVNYQNACSVGWSDSYTGADLRLNEAVDPNIYQQDEGKTWVTNWIDNCGCTTNNGTSLRYFLNNETIKNVYENKCGSIPTSDPYSCERQSITDDYGNTKNVYYYKNTVYSYNYSCEWQAAQDRLTGGVDGKIVVYENEGHGLSCNTWNTPQTGSCSISGTINSTVAGPNISILSKGDAKFLGWSTSASCETINITDNNFKINSGTTTYYACYDEKPSYEEQQNINLFNSNGKITIDESSSSENNTCNSSNATVIDTYNKTTTKLYEEKLKDNAYCNVVCTDKVSVTYPSIFESVPAGQYFELMYEPEITATRTCTSKFDSTNWKTAYDNAVKNELAKMDALNLAEANLEALNNITCSSATCIVPSPCEGEAPCVQTCAEWSSSGSSSQSYSVSSSAYGLTTNQRASGTSTISESSAEQACEENKSTQIGSESSGATKALKDAKEAYKQAVNTRLALEQKNLQCYTILDQDNDNSKTYEDVFKTNYTYKIGNNEHSINDTTYQIESSKVNVSYNNSTSGIVYNSANNITTSPNSYANYITTNTNISPSNLTKNNINTGTKTVDFYAIYPQLVFSYDDGTKGKAVELNQEQTLSSEAHVKLDTGSFTGNSYTKDNTTTTITKSFYFNGNYSNYINFKYYTATTTTRQVEYYFTYHESIEYLSQIQSGNTIQKRSTLPKNYVSLSRIETLKDKENNEISVSNHVYPVSLKAVADKYDVKFKIDDAVGLNTEGGYTDYFNNRNIKGYNGNYSCSYEITNDTLTISEEQEKIYKNLKSNTIFRSVATNNLDPNDRSSTGKLGENWLNKKGTAAMKQIQETEGDTDKNTYHPDNLEYSFTLTPTLIRAIKCYNQIQESNSGYDDFNLTCSTEDGRECISEFLTNLAQGKVEIKGSCDENLANDVIQSNYSSINPNSALKLTEARKTWKYYNGLTIEKMASKTVTGSNKKQAMSLNEYLENYSKWGVLP